MRALLAILLLTTALLAGCTGGTDDPATTAASSPSTTGDASGLDSSTTAAPPTTSGTSTSQATTGTNGTTTTGTTTTNTTTTGGGNQTTGPSTPDPVSQECAIGGGVYGNTAQSCTLPDFASSNGASFTKGTATFTYQGNALPQPTLLLTDGAGNEIASASGASPITINLDGKVPAGALVQITGKASAVLFAGFGGTLKVDLS
ncbi:MAG: hypothetical protein QOD77_884 [Thermoplasmata archaeon]|jgi:hypothetical protein|nr:hypothetical protein [Thermoplasmata archaeon]